MIVMGIDPGFATTGYGIVDYVGNRFRVLDYGVIKTEADTPFPERLLALHTALDGLIRNWKPEVMAVEELFFGANVTTGIKVGHARGVILLSAAMLGIPAYEYTPMQVKLAVAGYGGAKKPQVQQMVKVLLGLEAIPRPDDAADALAVAICQAHTGMLRARTIETGRSGGSREAKASRQSAAAQDGATSPLKPPPRSRRKSVKPS